MSNRSEPTGREPATDAADDDLLVKVGFAALLAFMVGGLIGGASRLNTALDSSLSVLFVNGQSYGIVLVTMLMVIAGYGVGQYAGNR